MTPAPLLKQDPHPGGRLRPAGNALAAAMPALALMLHRRRTGGRRTAGQVPDGGLGGRRTAGQAAGSAPSLPWLTGSQ